MHAQAMERGHCKNKAFWFGYPVTNSLRDTSGSQGPACCL